MKFKVYLYKVTRILFGVALTSSGAYNVIVYSSFLLCLEDNSEKVSLFNFEFIHVFLVLVPFAKFIIGLFLTLGFYTREVLIGAVIVFLFVIMYLLDINSETIIFMYVAFLMMSGILLKKDNYNLNSMDYTRDLF